MQQSLADFFDQLAARTPTPGGGAVAASGAILACSLARMVVGYSLTKNATEAVRQTVAEADRALLSLDACLRPLIEADAQAYLDLRAAMKDRSTLSDGEQRYQQAVLVAAGVPSQIVALAVNLLETLDGFKPACSPYMVSDLGVAAVMAHGAARSASYMVRVNVAEITDQTMKQRILASTDQLVKRAATACQSIEQFVSQKM